MGNSLPSEQRVAIDLISHSLQRTFEVKEKERAQKQKECVNKIQKRERERQEKDQKEVDATAFSRRQLVERCIETLIDAPAGKHVRCATSTNEIYLREVSREVNRTHPKVRAYTQTSRMGIKIDSPGVWAYVTK